MSLVIKKECEVIESKGTYSKNLKLSNILSFSFISPSSQYPSPCQSFMFQNLYHWRLLSFIFQIFLAPCRSCKLISSLCCSFCLCYSPSTGLYDGFEGKSQLVDQNLIRTCLEFGIGFLQLTLHQCQEKITLELLARPLFQLSLSRKSQIHRVKESLV